MPTSQNKYVLGPGFIAQYFGSDADLCSALAESLPDIVNEESIMRLVYPALRRTLDEAATPKDFNTKKGLAAKEFAALLRDAKRVELQSEVLAFVRAKPYLRHYLRDRRAGSSDRIGHSDLEGSKAKDVRKDSAEAASPPKPPRERKEGRHVRAPPPVAKQQSPPASVKNDRSDIKSSSHQPSNDVESKSVEELVRTVESVLAQLSDKTPEAATRIIIKELCLLPRERTDKDGTLQSDWSRTRGNSEGSEVKLEVEAGPVRAPKGFEARVAFHTKLDILWQERKAARFDIDGGSSMAISGSRKVTSTLHGRLFVSDAQHLDQLVRELVTSLSLPIRTTCSTFSLVVGGIPVKAIDPFAASVLIDGFDSCSDLRMELFDLPRASDAGGGAKGMEIIGKATFRSKSIVGVDIDSIKIALGYRDPYRKRSVGTVTLRSIFIRSGRTLPLRLNGRFNADDPTHSREALADLITDVLTGAEVKIAVSIQSVKLFGGKSLDWQQADVRIPVVLPCTKRADLLQEVQLKSIELRFGKDGRPTLTCNDMRAKVRLPYAFEVKSVTITGALGLKWRDRTSDTFRTLGAFRYQEAGRRSTSVTPLNKKPDCKTSRATFEYIQSLETTDADALHKFMATAVGADSTELQIDASNAKLVLGTRAGDLTLDPGSVVRQASVKGFGESRDIQAQLTDLQFDEDEKNLRVTMEACFDLAGDISISAKGMSEPVSMLVTCRHDSGVGDVLLGRASLRPSFTITPGQTRMRISFDFPPNAPHVKRVGHLLGHLLSGRPSKLRFKGDDRSSNSPGLLTVLKSMKMQGTLAPLSPGFQQSGAAGVGAGGRDKTAKTLEGTFRLVDKHSNLRIRLHKFDGTLTLRGKPWASLVRINSATHDYRIELRQTLGELGMLYTSVFKETFHPSLYVKGTLGIGKYTIEGFEVYQEDLALYVRV